MPQKYVPPIIRQLMFAVTKQWPSTIAGNIRFVSTPIYNSIFNVSNGTFARCGVTVADNPHFCPIGPEIMYIEVSTICHQCCPWCYKSNRDVGKNMSLETFSTIVKKLPRSVVQIAFGIGDLTANPDLFAILKVCRDRRIIPNITINGIGLTDALAERLASVCGAVAISRYTPADRCYDAVKKLSPYVKKPGYTLSQIGVYQLLAMETYDQCLETIRSFSSDERLKKAFSLTFLTLKPKGKRNTFHRIVELEKYKTIIDEAVKANIVIGFDCCAAMSINAATKMVRDLEPCEAGLFGMYCNVDGIISPCSFLEGEPGFPAIDLLSANDFTKDVWNHPSMVDLRGRILSGDRRCPRWNLEF